MEGRASEKLLILGKYPPNLFISLTMRFVSTMQTLKPSAAQINTKI